MPNGDQEKKMRALAEQIIDDIYKALARKEDPQQIINDIVDRYSINIREADLPRFMKYVTSLVDKRVQKVEKFRREFAGEIQRIRGLNISKDDKKRLIKESRPGFLEKHLEAEREIYSSKVEAERERRRKKIGRRVEEEGLEKEEEHKKKHYVRGREWIQSNIGPKILDGLILAAMVGIGAVVSGTLGSTMFFLGFLFWGIYYLLPNPNSFDMPKEFKEGFEGGKMPGVFSPGMQKFYKRYFNNQHSGWGILRTMLKSSVFFCFISGLWNNHNVPFVNIALIIVCFIGYYSFKITYDPEKPYELMESLMRFAGLGAFVIPFLIFYSLFDSFVLTLIAVAFFAIPPIPNDRNKSDLFLMYDFYDKFFFIGIMGLVLIGFYTGWEVPKAMEYTFLYFVIVTGIAGFFSPAEARPGIGFMMITAASIIYGIGPGQQEVASTFLGPWWPQIQNTFSSITEPVVEAFSGLGDTFRTGFMLLTNPVGYATQLMNGTHAENPLGESGALGVEITDFTVSQLFVSQPYLITATIQNKGAFDATNVDVKLSVDSKNTKDDKMKVDSMNLDIGEGNKGEVGCKLEDSKCRINIVSGDAEFGKQNIDQVGFSSKSGIICDKVKEHELTKFAIPLIAWVSYGYEVDSRLEIEFISDAEWNRLTQLNMLFLKDVQSEYSTAPVKFPLGTAGLKQPIKADQQFHIGLMLDTDQKNGRIESIEEIKLYVPADFGKAECNPNPDGEGGKIGSDTNMLVWTKGKSIEDEKSKIIYCRFEALKDTVTGPTKTYLVIAHARYKFYSWKTKSTRLEFGGYCCPGVKETCLDGQKCCAYTEGGGGYCLPKDEFCQPGSVEPSDPVEFGEAKYCENNINSNAVKCGWGEGGCQIGKDECYYPDGEHPNYGKLECKTTGIGVNLCCFESEPETLCIQKFDDIKNK